MSIIDLLFEETKDEHVVIIFLLYYSLIKMFHFRIIKL